MVKRIKWTIQAEQEFADIFDYWVIRNKCKLPQKRYNQNKIKEASLIHLPTQD